MRLQVDLHCVERLYLKLIPRQDLGRIPICLRDEIVPAPSRVLCAEIPGNVQYFATSHVMLLPVTPGFIQYCAGQLIGTGNFSIRWRRDVGVVIFGKSIPEPAGSQRKKLAGLALVQSP